MVFDDLDTLTRRCRFADCTHQSEPGCALLAALDAGQIAPERVARWQEPCRKDRINSETLAKTHARDRGFGRMVRAVLRDKARRPGR